VQKESLIKIGWAEDNGNGETGPMVEDWDIVFSYVG
jgi:hypothetical protein